jgi:hypothetical protein
MMPGPFLSSRYLLSPRWCSTSSVVYREVYFESLHCILRHSIWRRTRRTPQASPSPSTSRTISPAARATAKPRPLRASTSTLPSPELARLPEVRQQQASAIGIDQCSYVTGTPNPLYFPYDTLEAKVDAVKRSRTNVINSSRSLIRTASNPRRTGPSTRRPTTRRRPAQSTNMASMTTTASPLHACSCRTTPAFPTHFG